MQYILLIQNNVTSPTLPVEWDDFFATARKSGLFRGGSAMGKRETLGNPATAQSSGHLDGYMTFETDDKQLLLDLLKHHPVLLHGGSVELCELPKT